MTDPAELWRFHQDARFPPSCLALVKLDAAVGAILTASLRRDGVARPLDGAKRLDLERHLESIRKALRDPGLDAEGRAYFERLAALSDHVLNVR